MILTGKLLFNQAVIYVVKRGETYLYIGSSECLVQRLGGHEKVNRITVRHTDTIELIECADIESARQLESKMLDRYEPLWNIRLY